MIDIPYSGLAPVPASFPQLPIMPMPARQGSAAQQNAADFLSRVPRQPDPPNILSQIADGADAASRLWKILSPPSPAPLLTPLQGLIPEQPAAMPSVTAPSGPIFFGGGTMQMPSSNITVTPPALPQMGLLERIARGIGPL
jgi:hypothetical protein